MSRTYSELILLPTFVERYHYLELHGGVGIDTFGSKRYLNQAFYHSDEWLRFRNHIITRDYGRDLGVEGYDIGDHILIHHLNPITVDDIIHGRSCLLDPENAICVSHNTHQAIHYGDESLLPKPPVERRPNDTCPWKH